MAVFTHVVYQLYFFYLSTIQYNLTRLCMGSFRQEKMLPPLMMKMAVAAAPPPSGKNGMDHSRYWNEHHQ